MRTVHREVGGIVSAKDATQTREVVFTAKNYGEVDDGGEKVTPMYADQPALMVVLPHQRMPISSAGMTDSKDPILVSKTFIAFLSLTTGDIYTAVAYTETGEILAPPEQTK